MDINWWLFIGILIIVVGFMLKVDSLAVVLVAAIVTAVIGGMGVVEILEVLGNRFVANRGMSIFLLTLPIVGISERFGLKEQAVKTIQKVKSLTAGRVSWLYQLVRQVSAAMSLKLGGHPQFVRPLIYPMAEGAALAQKGSALSDEELDTIKGAASAADNYGSFFGQNLFPAASGVALIVGTMKDAGYAITNNQVVLWSIPVFIIILIVSGVQFSLLDRKFRREK